MRRCTTLIVLLTLTLAVVVALTGCSQTADANKALAAANAQLTKYLELDAQMAEQLAAAGAVEATPEGVVPGLEALDAVDKQMPDRTAAVAAAKEQFQRIRGLEVKAAIKGYADQSLKLITSLEALDAGVALQVKDMRELYTLVEKRSTDTRRIQQLADSVEAAKAKVDRLRRRVKSESQAADDYYQKNLAPKSGQ